jgi:hypothetical protein
MAACSTRSLLRGTRGSAFKSAFEVIVDKLAKINKGI